MNDDRGSSMPRDRDAVGRASNARPRDELGRPLPRGAQGTEQVPEDLVLAPNESLVAAQQLLDAERPFHAHEVLEGTWKSAPEPERELWQGLAQLAVGVTHLMRGNDKGATAVLQRCRSRLVLFRDRPPYDIDVVGLVAWCDRELLRLEEHSGAVPLVVDPPQLRERTAE